ncbi:hypothetical protein [Brevundimonas sp. DC300-4]|uniref:hypothetical protein n=1 Tax=Brevundimonas sp. DC300-4 TaxID=2804594 RepID=UPI003CF405F4
MKHLRAVVGVAVAISMSGCGGPVAVQRGADGLVPNIEICASATDQYARRGQQNFEPDGQTGVETEAIFYRAKLHVLNGVPLRQIALLADRGEEPLPVPPGQIDQQNILRQCEKALDRQLELPADDEQAAETCYVAAKFMRAADLDDPIIRRVGANNGRLASIGRASTRQSRDEIDTFVYLDALGSALIREPLDRTIDTCRQRFLAE